MQMNVGKDNNIFGDELFKAFIVVLFRAVSGKECESNENCRGIANTTCMKHPEDNKKRCLCGEKKSPHNGACHHSKQGLHLKCNVDDDCIRDAVCKVPTNSSNGSRMCECKEGYEEEDHECS
ncbi:hypothetical protein Cfor_07996, partial [Coptotermes formosanus]